MIDIKSFKKLKLKIGTKEKNKKPLKDQKLNKQDSKSKLSNPYIDELEKK